MSRRCKCGHVRKRGTRWSPLPARILEDPLRLLQAIIEGA